jgi:hypothetical protein
MTGKAGQRRDLRQVRTALFGLLLVSDRLFGPTLLTKLWGQQAKP